MRLARLASLALLAAVLAGCAQSAPPAPVPATPPTGLDDEGFFPVQFGAHRFLEKDLAGGDATLRLHADIYLPDQPTVAGAPTKFPTILLLSPYWGGGTHDQPIGYMPYDFLVQRLLPRGYAIVFGDLGGNGGSSGCWDFMGPVERQSAYNMVEAIAGQEWSDGQVGMFGLSYDAMTQIMASSDAAPHLVTVVPASGLTEAYKGLKMGGVHYAGGWHSTIPSYEQSSVAGPGPTNADRQAGWVETLGQTPECAAANHTGDDQTGAYDAYYQARDFRPLASKVKASVFVTQGFFDPAVKPDNFGAWFNGVPGEKKAWLGFWYHQYPTAQGSGRDDMYLTFHRWFDHTLKGARNGIDKEPRFDVQDSLGQWRHEPAWPPTDAATLVLEAGADKSLSPSAAGKEGTLGFGGVLAAGDLATGGDANALVLTGSPLAAPLHIAGTPVLNASFVPLSPHGYVIARLYDGDRQVSQGSYNGMFAAGLGKAQPMTYGSAVHLAIALYPTDWVVQAGHTLKLTLTTVDGQQWFDPSPGADAFQLKTGPDARLELPTIQRSDASIFLTSCGLSLKQDVPGCFQDRDDQGVPKPR